MLCICTISITRTASASTPLFNTTAAAAAAAACCCCIHLTEKDFFFSSGSGVSGGLEITQTVQGFDQQHRLSLSTQHGDHFLVLLHARFYPGRFVRIQVLLAVLLAVLAVLLAVLAAGFR